MHGHTIAKRKCLRHAVNVDHRRARTVLQSCVSALRERYRLHVRPLMPLMHIPGNITTTLSLDRRFYPLALSKEWPNWSPWSDDQINKTTIDVPHSYRWWLIVSFWLIRKDFCYEVTAMPGSILIRHDGSSFNHCRCSGDCGNVFSGCESTEVGSCNTTGTSTPRDGVESSQRRDQRCLMADSQ